MAVSNEDVVKALRTSLKEAERLRGQNRQLLARRSEPIAIVGIGCRFPGEVGSPRDLWELVAAGRDAIGEMPDDRGWDMDRLYDPDPEQLGTTYVRKGAFLYDVAEFDAGFFGIGPREALAMDPQQRLLLEGTWEALEDAGVDPGSLRGSSTGVFVGAVRADYTAGGMTIAPGLEAQLGTGLSGSVASGRIAYTLGLEGPAVTIDTACSSSLVAMHLAAQALRSDECELALAGGATVHATLGTFVGMSRQRGLALDGRPKSYAGAADGTAWGEASGMVLLERLSVAKAKGRRIHAVIRGSAVNQDGASNGLIAPNGPSQERVIRQALANAGLSSSEVDAVEGHGTGTPLGDPIEAQALLATYGQEREDGPLWLGSLKSNVGHTVAAAGVGGVIKMVMALREEALPQTLHVDEPTPHVDWDSGEIELLTEQREWKRGERPRRAGVSSFGISGTNAHLILEEAPEQEAPEREEAEEPIVIVWALSAKSPEALREYAVRLTGHVEREQPDALDVARTLLASRASLSHRALVAGGDQAQLLEGLKALAQRKPAPNLVTAKTSHGKTAFLFSGQGSQRPQMGAELYEAFPAYREAFEDACEALSAELGKDVKEAVFAKQGSDPSESLRQTDMTQASLFCLEVSLYRLLESFGAKPDFLIGHSIGEVAAAHVAGVLSLSDAAKLVAARGSLMAALPSGGAMASVRATEQEVIESLAPYAGRLCIAAVNAPASIAVSGEEEALVEWEQEQEQADRKTKRLDVSHAFHSHRMEPMLSEFEQRISTLDFNAPQIPIVSNPSGEELSAEQATSPAYWASQVREPVRFAAGIAYLRQKGASRFVELGPQGTLTAIAAECIEGEEVSLVPAMRREQPDALSFALALGELRAAGGKADLGPLVEGGSLVELPTYPFQRERFWLVPGSGSLDPAELGQAATEHPMLAASISLAREREQVFTGRLSVETHPWLGDHVVAGAVIVPGTAFCELALRAGADIGAERLEEIVMESPLLLGEGEAVQIQVSVATGEAGAERLEFAIHSRAERDLDEEQGEPPWIRHASGTLAPEAQTLALDFDATAWPPPGAEPLDVDAFYDLTVAAGFEYGPAFQGLEAAWRLGGEIYGEIALGEDQRAEAERFGIHPALLDAALHPALVEAAGSEGGLRLPFSFSGVGLGAGRGAEQLRVRVRVEGERVSLAAATPEGAAVCAIASLAMRPVESFALDRRPAASADLFQRGWEPLELDSSRPDGEFDLHRLTPAEGLDPAQGAHRLATETLAAIQAFLGEERDDGHRLAFLSSEAVAIEEDEVPDAAVAAAWGLVRSAQSEHPGRFVLVDGDGCEESEGALAAAVAAGEPEVVLRDGRARVPRLAPAGEPADASLELNRDGTVLVSGGLSALGALAARHLVEAHGVRRLLLAGRRGPESEGAEELLAELTELGCEATAVACDVSDRAQVKALLDDIPAERPLSAIVHCAGVLDDGTVESLDDERLERVLAPKVDGAWHLHELSAGLELDAFVLYSSAAAVFGSPGQGNYAAANSFLDALARRRDAEGLPATSIAWGMWEAGMAARLGEAEQARLGRTGLSLIDAERGAALFDRALALGDPSPVAVPLDRAALRALAEVGLLPPLLSGLAPAARRRARVAVGSLARRLAEVPEAEREALVLREVREHVASILGHSSADSIDPETSFKELGFDSLGAVELRNRLSDSTGVRLAATLVFDHPSSAAIAAHLVGQVEPAGAGQVAVRHATSVDEPVAIVGIGCRFPGGGTTPRSFWQFVAEGGDGISGFPRDRGWDVERLYDPDPERQGKSYVREGGFLDDAAGFDPAFFGIGPREALAMDPQQRLLLEGAWEALEDAGIDPVTLRRSATGVYAGVMMADYAAGGAALSAAGLEGFGTGIAGSVASGRIAYALGLEGPAMTVDTACSSSLVAMHLAAGALRAGECDLALAGGTTVLSTPAAFVEFSRQRVFAPDGRAKSFAAAADGTAWGEGMGLVLLERLSDAKRNGRRIHAVIRGSAVNQDGASNGLTAPNGPSQERVIRQALANAGLTAAEVDAVEAHGTGTVLGDPIEAQALLATYGQDRVDGPLAVGSLKSNFGHTQAAAGVGGVIKMAMALREEALPQTLHVDEPTPHVDWSSGEIELLTEQREWKRGERPRRAGVSSFGISGTNAHLILEEAPEREAPEREERERPPIIPWALSAKSPEALREQAGRLAAHVEQGGEDPVDVAHTLLSSRASLPHRAVTVGADVDELLAGLDALAQGKEHPALVTGRAVSRSKVAFVFPGQGSQWAGMAAELLEQSESFAASMAECEAALAPHVDFSLTELLRGEEEEWLGRIEVVQTALFAVMVSLAELWRAHGVKPAAVVGHSQGEIAAAVVAGALSLEDGARLCALRARALRPLMGKGEMASFALSAAEMEALLEPYGERLSIAAHNGPGSTVCSGEPVALEELVAACEADGERVRMIPVGYASHCAQVNEIEAELKAAAAGIEPLEGGLPIYSTLTGGPIDAAELTAEYWWRNLREPVRFQQAVERLVEDGFGALVEQSAHPVLAMALEETAQAVADRTARPAVLHTLRRDDGGMKRFLTSLAWAHVEGVAADLGSSTAHGTVVELPTYPFQRERFWLDAGLGGGDPSGLGLDPTEHPMLVASLGVAGDGQRLFTGRLRLADHRWMRDHAVMGAVILPGSAFCEMALCAGAELGAERLEELIVAAPLLLPEAEGVRIQLTASPSEMDPERFEFAIHSRIDGSGDEEDGEDELPWVLHASGALRAAEQPLSLDFDFTAWPPAGAEPIGLDDFYDRAADAGIEYGPALQGLEAAWQRDGEIFAEVALAPEQRLEAERFLVHPALLDAALQAGLAAVDPSDFEGQARLPFAWSGISVQPGAKPGSMRVRVTAEGESASIEAADPDGLPVCSVGRIHARPIDASLLQRKAGQTDELFRLDWVEVDLPEEPEAAIEVYRVAPTSGEDPATASHTLTALTLERIQGFLADDDRADTRLAIVVEGTVAVGEGDLADPAAAAAAGLVRSAQFEHPGRFALVDTDGSDASEARIGAAGFAVAEPQIALRDGVAHAPRLRVAEEEQEVPAPAWRSVGTVLITGGFSTLGALTARHLAEDHGVEHILLAGRRGAEAPGGEELIGDLAELGCEATAVACDVSDRATVEKLLAGIPAERPLSAVVHCAGALDDALVDSLDAARLDAVLTPKADAAWHLHELTRGLDLSAFVLYSSVAGVFGNPGQGNYAAANSFLDALAARRRAEGLAATSISWGLWRTASEMTSHLDEADRSRFGRLGLGEVEDAQGLRLLDRACARGDSHLVAVPIERAALRRLARAGMLPALFAGLAPSVRRRMKIAAGAFARRLEGLTPAEREEAALAEVRGHVAAILGHASADAVDPLASFQELGFDSLGAVELRNRLSEATGVPLEATLVFDHPSSGAIASYLLRKVAPEAAAGVAVRAARGVDEPVAIVGMGCRYPGGVASPRELWELLAAGEHGMADFPTDRGWEVERLYDPDPDRPGKTYVRQAGFLEAVGDFDPAFFGIGPREALAMDPQQRLLLETAWEALEGAGVAPASLRGSATGVFAGLMLADYAAGGMALSRAGLEGFGSGVAGSVASGRIAYTLGLEGPAVTVDTACSSSLVAMHLAAQALRSGECELALAGGATVMSTSGMFVEFSRQRVLSPGGRCKSFADGADGTAWGEGCGLVLLERLSDAKRNGRRIHAVIRGSATNQDGASNGLTAPNGPSQERVIRQALANSGLTPAEVDAVEAHGTGTVLGDPIEAQALLATYGQDRVDGPLALGSLKSNFGHTQAAAGVGGVIKMVMALREEALPQTLHVDEPTPHVDWQAGEIELLTEQREWKRGERPRRAGVSSFGISGTNAHLILEEAPEQPAPERDEAGAPPVIPWALSAKSPEALRDYAGRLAAHVEKEKPDPLDVAHTLLSSRASLPHRAVLAGEDTEQLLAGLDALAQAKPAPSLATAKVSHGKTAFLLSGQGSQRAQMGKGLYDAFPAYREAFEDACEALSAELGKDVKEAVFADQGTELSQSLSRTDMTQASLFCLEVSLYRLAESFGSMPDYLIGHSIGEVSAAHVAGVLSLSDAAKLVAARGSLMATLPSGGAMASVRASEQEVEESLAPYAGRLGIAAVNAPASIAVSGEEDALAEWEAEQQQAGRKTKRLEVSHAFHSHLMEPMLEEFEQRISELDFNVPQIPIVSNRTGEELTEKEATSPAYWVSQVREPVRFAQGIAYLKDKGASRLLELGPQGTLTAIAAECIEGEEVSIAPALRKEQPEASCLIAALGALHASGGRVDLSLLCSGGALVELPTYSFQRDRYWLDADLGQGDPTAFGQIASDHPMLGASVALAGDDTRLLTGRISRRDPAWTAEHIVMGTPILPGAAIVELALRAGREVGAERLEELVIEAPLPVPEGAVQLQVTVSPEGDPGRFRLAVHSRASAAEEPEDEAPWIRHATGVLSAQAKAQGIDLGADWPPADAEPADVDAFYDIAAEFGVELGPAFQGMEAVWRRGEEIFAEVSLAEEQRSEAERCEIHPALLDAAAQVAVMAADASGFEQGARLPFAWTGVEVEQDIVATRLRVRAVAEGEALKIEATDPAGVPVCSVEGLHLRPVAGAEQQARDSRSDILHEIVWTPVEPPRPSGSSEVELHRAPATRPDEDDISAVHELAGWALARLKEALSDEGGATRRTAFLTRGAVALSAGESADVAGAAVWGLVRSAQSEHPGRFLLIDSDGSEASADALDTALAVEGESQVVLREGSLFVPRLEAVAGEEEPSGEAPFGAAGTVLVTGGLSGLGAMVARHLAAAHGVEHLLLAGRRGPETPGAAELIEELGDLGCEAQAAMCDVGDRAQLEGLLGAIPAEQPLVGVVHCAGVLDDGVVDGLDRERLDRVLAPKADAALHLHELTRELELGAFVLYSSIASTLGTPGQANYAAANAVLDALAQRRRSEGLPATSIAWGLWEEPTGMTAGLAEGAGGAERLAGTGLVAMDAETGLALFDRALLAGRPLSVALPLQERALRGLARAGLLPPILSGLVRVPVRRSRAVPGALTRRLAEAAEEERERILLEVVREQVAASLGHPSADAVDVDSTLLELGMDSLGAVELRNRLAAVAEVQIPPTAAFDHPTTAALAAYLESLLAERGGAAASSSGDVASTTPNGTLRTLFASANRDGRTLEVARLLIDAAALRPVFESPADLEAPPRTIPISRQGEGPLLICVPSFLAGSGPHQFARIGQALGGRRRIAAVALPGHGREELLPASWDTAVDALALSVLRAAGDDPFVLLGYSSGGAVAHALAERFERDGERLAGLAMIDSFLPQGDGLVELFGATMGQLLAIDHDALAIDDDQLIAMGAYLRFAPQWSPGAVGVPGLMLRASEGLASMQPDSAELPAWQLPETTIELTGSHFSLIAEDAAATAEAIDGWLTDRIEPDVAVGAKG